MHSTLWILGPVHRPGGKLAQRAGKTSSRTVTIYDDFPLFFQIYYEFLRIPGGGRRVPASGGDKHIIVSLGVTWRRGTDQDSPYQPPTGRTPIR